MFRNRSVVASLALLALGSCGSESDGTQPQPYSTSTSGAGGAGGGTTSCEGVVCTEPGEVCVAGACVEDCRRPGAVACPASKVCDVSDASPGQCVDADAPCVTSSAAEPCGGAKTCGPGSACDPQSACYPRVPCTGVECDGDTCWGIGCACTRIVTCDAAPIGAPGQPGTLHDPAFVSGLVDLEFDPTCGAWGATLISGPDYLRSILPDGTVDSIAGITNLNMGEVAVLQQIIVPKSGEIHTPLDAAGLDVSLAYICCSTCGCMLDSTPQGVARLEPLTKQLPLVIPSTTFTTGVGPFGQAVIDTGPAGVSYGLDRVLYVGNVDQSGDYYRLDLATQMQTLVTTFAARVHASCAFDAIHMLVALEGGEMRLLRISDGTSSVFATSDQPVTGLVRDFFDGSIYVARIDGSVLRYDETGASAPYQTTVDPARVSIAPDGWLYALEIPAPYYDHVPRVTRWELPKMR